MFTAPDDISKMTIGPPHRSSLGIGWRRGSHPAMPRARSKWEARLTVESKTILKRAGIFISVGSGKCTHAVLLIYGNSGS